MKRTIAILLFFISCMLYAETGYRGFEWGTSEFIFELKTGTEENPIEIDIEPFNQKVYKTRLLGEERNLFYLFMGKELYAAFYYIPVEQTEKLLKNFDNYNLLAQAPLFTDDVEAEIPELLNRYKDDQDKDRKIELMVGINCVYICFYIETEIDLDDLPKEESNNQLYIYNYNNDTRVYIFKNFFEGKTVVVYHPHEQDY